MGGQDSVRTLVVASEEERVLGLMLRGEEVAKERKVLKD